MDLQTRKLNLITYLAQIKDELFFDKLEKYILDKEQEQNPGLTAFSVEELISRIERSERDVKNGNVKSQNEIEKASENW